MTISWEALGCICPPAADTWASSCSEFLARDLLASFLQTSRPLNQPLNKLGLNDRSSIIIISHYHELDNHQLGMWLSKEYSEKRSEGCGGTGNWDFGLLSIRCMVGIRDASASRTTQMFHQVSVANTAVANLLIQVSVANTASTHFAYAHVCVRRCLALAFFWASTGNKPCK